jgi:hypothetical protein
MFHFRQENYTVQNYLETPTIFFLACIKGTRSRMVGFGVFMVASMKMAFFWVVALCSLVEGYQCYRGTCCLHQGDEQQSKPCVFKNAEHEMHTAIK